MILLTILVQGTTLPAVIRWAQMPEDTGRAEELQLARVRATQAGLDALPQVAAELGIDDDLLRRVQAEYEEHAQALRAGDDTGDGQAAADGRDLERRLRLGVLEHKRRAVVDLRDANRIHDIVLRELQAAMDLEEVRLGPPPTE